MEGDWSVRVHDVANLSGDRSGDERRHRATEPDQQLQPQSTGQDRSPVTTGNSRAMHARRITNRDRPGGTMRHLVTRVGIILAIIALTCSVPALASADTATSSPSVAAADPYTSKSPWTVYGSYRCLDSQVRVAKASIEGSDGPGQPGLYWGTVSIWKSTVCQSYWATVNFDFKMPSNRWGTAQLTRIYGTQRASWSCDGAGGNKHVSTGQTSCYTGMIYAPSSAVSFYVIGDVKCPKDGLWYTCVRGQVGYN
jgi:hypothetical protein